MENRFESLFGYAQRSLVKNIRKEFGNHESITIGFLLFNSYSECFFYESTVKNTLVFLKEIKKQFHEIEIWDMELMFFLGKYLSQKRTKGYIVDLINDNNKLVPQNASYYAIAFDDYELFKSEWINWITDLSPQMFEGEYVKDREPQRTILNQLFYFGNYLLTIIGYDAYKEGGSGSFREHIYRVIINQIIFPKNDMIEPTTGDLKPNQEGHTWHREAETDSLLKYPDLALALEICFKQPFSVKDKIQDLKAIIDESEAEGKTFQLAAMAKPLFYNGEFQGIIYITRNMQKGNFNAGDFEKFKQVIGGFHIESLLNSSKFDTARILLEKITAADFQLQIHPLLKTLNAQHIFSSSPLGIVIIPGVSSFIRYRDNKLMQTKKINLEIEKTLNLFEQITSVNIKDILNETNYFWCEIPNIYEETFNKSLCSEFEITEEIFIKSFTCMKFRESDNNCFYFLFNSNHIEQLSSESSNAIKQSYALRTYSNINKLIDAYSSQKRLSDIQNNLLNELQLGFIHQEKSFLKENVLNKMNEIDDLNPIRKIRSITEQVRTDTRNAIDRFSIFLKVCIEQSNELNKTSIGIIQLEQEISEIKKGNKLKNVKLISDLSELNPTDRVESYLHSISFCINELVTNAIKQYNSDEGQKLAEKEIKIFVKPALSADHKRIGFVFEVFNTGTFIPDTIKEIAGKERVANGSNNSFGFGLLLVKQTLKRILAAQIASDQYFSITDKHNGTEIKFTVYNKLIRK